MIFLLAFIGLLQLWTVRMLYHVIFQLHELEHWIDVHDDRSFFTQEKDDEL